MDYFAVPRQLPPRLTQSNWWGVFARILLDPDGKVIEKALAIDDGRSHQGFTIWIDVREDARLLNPCEHRGVTNHPGYLPYRAMRYGGLVIEISSEAKQKLIHRAFDVHLECLNRIHGCDTPGDIAAAAWQDSFLRAEDYQQPYQQWAKTCMEKRSAAPEK
jgi:hypothetical protein